MWLHAKSTGKTAPNSLTLRSEAVAHMKRHADRYVRQWDGLAPGGRRLWSEFEKVDKKVAAFETYLKEVAEPTAWAGELEAAALGRKYNCKIVIIPQKLDFAQVHTLLSGPCTVWTPVQKSEGQPKTKRLFDEL